MAITADGGIHHLIGAHGDDIISFSVESKEKSIGGWMYKEPGNITPTFDYSESKLS